jgi:hypothetical protein
VFAMLKLLGKRRQVSLRVSVRLGTPSTVERHRRRAGGVVRYKEWLTTLGMEQCMDLGKQYGGTGEGGGQGPSSCVAPLTGSRP